MDLWEKCRFKQRPQKQQKFSIQEHRSALRPCAIADRQSQHKIRIQSADRKPRVQKRNGNFRKKLEKSGKKIFEKNFSKVLDFVEIRRISTMVAPFNYTTLFPVCQQAIFTKIKLPLWAVLLYILFGFFNVCGGWVLGWLILLTIPIYYWICELLKPKKSDCCGHNCNCE